MSGRGSGRPPPRQFHLHHFAPRAARRPAADALTEMLVAAGYAPLVVRRSPDNEYLLLAGRNG